ncbi:hypothetical protein H0H93_009398 [Arthromyces matolae]|nr:hypothetical protein H0H93_009398 [Arthromyces matolae]
MPVEPPPGLPPNFKMTNSYNTIQGFRTAGMFLSPAAAWELAKKLSPGKEIPDPAYSKGMTAVLIIIKRATRPHGLGFRTLGAQYGVDIGYLIVTHSEELPNWYTMDLSSIPLFEEEKGPGRDRVARKLLEDAGIDVEFANFFE